MQESAETPGFWTALASGRTPPDMVVLIGRLGAHLGSQGIWLRTVHTPKQTEILATLVGPTIRSYVGSGRRTNTTTQIRLDQIPALDRATHLAASIYEGWDTCNDFARAARLALLFALLGEELDRPSQFVVLFSRALLHEGATHEESHGLEAAALEVAAHLGIGTYNLADAGVRHRFRMRLDELGA